jgi:hypothetical protein
VTEYEAIREKSASQKRDTERALTRFVAKTSETHSLFLTEDTIFPCNVFFKFLNCITFQGRHAYLHSAVMYGMIQSVSYLEHS